MALAITPLHPHIGAEIGGLDVSRPIDTATLAALWAAIDDHAVLVFRDQQITDEQLRSFAARFGELEIGRSAARGGRRRLQFPEIGDISNLDEDNRLRTRDDQRRLDSLGNRLWHTDASFRRVPGALSMLSIRRIDIGVPCSMVTFCGAADGGGADGVLLAGAASGAGGRGGWEFSAMASWPVAAGALSIQGEPSESLE